MDTSEEAILERISQHDDFFCNMVNLIPPNMYFPQEEVDEEKIVQNKFKKAPSQVDAAQRKAKSAQNKLLKREKFDPANQKTTVERATEKGKQTDGSTDSENDEQEVGEEDSEGEEDDEEDDEQEEEEGDEEFDDGAEQGAEEDDEADDDEEVEGTSAMQSLRDRLNKKILQCRAERKTDVGGTTNPTNKRKKAAKEHAKEAKKKQKTEDSKAAKKEARKKQKEKKKAGAKEAEGDDSSKRKMDNASSSATSKKQKSLPAESVDVGNLKFSGLLLDGDQKPGGIPKKGQGVGNLIRKAESNKRRIEQLKQSEDGKAELQQMEMERAIRIASGEKIKDNLTLLKKAKKRTERNKKKSVKAWSNRTATEQSIKDGKQKKRSDNLKNSRSRNRKDPVTKQRPGFEGSKGSEFLNKE